MTTDTKCALITGSSRGIGRAIAIKLAAKGYRIAVHYFSDNAAAGDTLAKVREAGSDGFSVQADVTKPDNLARMFGEVRSQFGKLDVFVSNARPELPAFYQTPLEMTLDHWSTAVDSQARAFLIGVQHASELLLDGGRIIAITYSPGGRTGSWQPWAAMGPAKAAVESLCRYFAVALGPRAITVNAVSPGCVFGEPNRVEGGVLCGLPDAVQDSIQTWHKHGWTPLLRLGTPEDVAGAVWLLCTAEAGFITGQTLHVDGGAAIMDPLAPLEIQQPSLQARPSAAAAKP
jgi:enoyl-[acyl-carrier protein] reductase III